MQVINSALRMFAKAWIWRSPVRWQRERRLQFLEREPSVYNQVPKIYDEVGGEFPDSLLKWEMGNGKWEMAAGFSMFIVGILSSACIVVTSGVSRTVGSVAAKIAGLGSGRGCCGREDWLNESTTASRLVSAWTKDLSGAWASSAGVLVSSFEL